MYLAFYDKWKQSCNHYGTGAMAWRLVGAGMKKATRKNMRLTKIANLSLLGRSQKWHRPLERVSQRPDKRAPVDAGCGLVGAYALISLHATCRFHGHVLAQPEAAKQRGHGRICFFGWRKEGSLDAAMVA